MEEIYQACTHENVLICNECMTKEFTHILMKNGADVNTITHITREIRKKLEKSSGEGVFVCISCNQNLASLCTTCYSNRIKKVMYAYLPRGFSDKLLSLN